MSAVLLAVVFAGCHKEAVETGAPSPMPTPERIIVMVTPTPAPVAAATPSPATPAPRLAPEGVFYLVSAYRVEGKDGIVGLPPGTGVKRVREGIYLTPAGELPLDSELLTNDLDIARQARDADRAIQIASRPTAPSEPSSIAPMATPSPTLSIGAQRVELRKQRDLIYSQIRRLDSELNALPNRFSKTSPAVERINREMNTLREQIRRIDEQMIQLN